jgi:hypothetical protein
MMSDTKSEAEPEIVNKKSKKSTKRVQSESDKDFFKPTQEIEARGTIVKISIKSKWLCSFG